MPDRTLAPLHYRKLVADIIRIYDTARRSLVQAHWEIGQRIVEIEQDGASRAAYGSGLLSQLSADLSRECGQGFSPTNLKRFRQFYLLNPKGAPAHLLTWAHHVELLSVHDTKKRLALEKRAQEEELLRHELRGLIRKVQEKEKSLRPRSVNVTPLVPKRGPLHIYQIRCGADIGWPDPDVLVLDHGFRFYKALSPAESKAFRTGDIVEARGQTLRKTKDATKPGYKSGRVVANSPDSTLATKSGYKSGRVVPNSPDSTLATKPGYTYTTYVQKVIDGDTFWAAIDADRGQITRQKLRLRGIDCPEINTPEGKAAKKFVESVLAGVAFLTIFSYKNDNHDRFEADVFLPAQGLKTLAKGSGPECLNDQNGRDVFLNNLLLEQGHAVRVPGY